jgi:hypothetical protein
LASIHVRDVPSHNWGISEIEAGVKFTYDKHVPIRSLKGFSVIHPEGKDLVDELAISLHIIIHIVRGAQWATQRSRF